MSLRRKRMTLHLRLPRKIWGHLLQDMDAMLILIEDRGGGPTSGGANNGLIGPPRRNLDEVCASRLVQLLSFFKLY